MKFEQLSELCKSAAEEIKKKKNLLVVSHVDADGLTAAAIVCTALERRGLDFHSKFFRQALCNRRASSHRPTT